MPGGFDSHSLPPILAVGFGETPGDNGGKYTIVPTLTHEFDVVVIGCGIAGMSAAVSALEGGVSVAILERAPREERGGNTRWTEAYLRMKSETEVSDDFVEHFADNAGHHLDPSLVGETSADYDNWSSIVKTLNFTDPELVTNLAENAAPTLAWLKNHGVRFEFLPTFFLTMVTPRLLPVGGGLAMIEALGAKAEDNGASFFYETTARSLIQDDGGAVVGVLAASHFNTTVDFNAKAVIIASGGFEGNPEMLAQYLGPQARYLRPVARGGYYNKGEGIRMALGIGAAPAGDFGSYHAEPIDPRSGVSEPVIAVFNYGILVNQDGHRFIDEAPATVDATYDPITRCIFTQPGGIAYAVLDAKIDDVPNWQKAVRSDQPPIVADTLAELADSLAIDREVFEATVSTFNTACRPGTFKPLETDGLATVGIRPLKSNWARPIDSPPFQAFPIISANVFTYGGLKTDPRGQVVNVDGQIIPGLYAAGEVTGMYYGVYTGATSVLRGAVFGLISGRLAAQRARGNA